MKPPTTRKAILTDSHFLVPLVVFCIGLALLIIALAGGHWLLRRSDGKP